MEYNEIQGREDSAEKMELCLCSRCASDFYNMDNYRIKRVDILQTEKDTCTFCSYRRGYDFYVWPVSNARKPWQKGFRAATEVTRNERRNINYIEQSKL